MDIVSIKCPHCGGMIERQPNTYFVKCQYCGGEVCFNEIKEEAVIGEYSDKIDELERDIDVLEEKERKFRRWFKAKNVTLTVLGLCTFGVFTFFGLTKDDDNTALMSIGGFFLVMVMCIFCFVLPIISALYPAYDSVTKKKNAAAQLKQLFNLLLTGIAVCSLGALLAYIFLKTFGFA